MMTEDLPEDTVVVRDVQEGWMYDAPKRRN